MIQFFPVLQIAVSSASAVLPHQVPVFDVEEDVLSALQQHTRVLSTVTARTGSHHYEVRFPSRFQDSITIRDNRAFYHFIIFYERHEEPKISFSFPLIISYTEMTQWIKAFRALGADLADVPTPSSLGGSTNHKNTNARSTAFRGIHAR